jgi:hypothetical protein
MAYCQRRGLAKEFLILASNVVYSGPIYGRHAVTPPFTG